MRHTLYTVRCESGGTVRVDMDAGTLLCSQVPLSTQPEGLVCIPEDSRRGYFLFDNSLLAPLTVANRNPTGPIMPLHWRQIPGGRVNFFEPSSNSYLMASPNLQPDDVAYLSLSAPGVQEANCFTLTEAPVKDLTPAVRYQVDLIERVVATTPNSMLDLLRGASLSERPLLAGLLSETLLASEVEVFVDHIFEDREHVAAFASLFPDDPWAALGLPALFDFVRARQARAARRPIRDTSHSDTTSRTTLNAIGPELDCLAVAALPGKPVALTHRCMITARGKVAPLRDFCIIATARNDGLYLLDWLAYHQAIGVDRVFLYTNDNQDGSEILLRLLAAAGELSLIESTLVEGGVSPVSKAYGHALGMLPDVLDYRWCAIIDSDEYIGLDRQSFPSIKRFIEWQESQNVDVILLNWLVFGSSGKTRWSDEPLPARFQERYLDGHVKALFRPRFFHHAMPHFPYTKLLNYVTSRNAAGNPHQSFVARSVDPTDNPAWVAHYFYRSLEEFVWKFTRGRGDQPLMATSQDAAVPEEFMSMFIEQQGGLVLVKDARLHAFADEAGAHAVRLKAIPGVLEALESVQAYYREKSRGFESRLHRSGLSGSAVQSAFSALVVPST